MSWWLAILKEAGRAHVPATTNHQTIAARQLIHETVLGHVALPLALVPIFGAYNRRDLRFDHQFGLTNTFRPSIANAANGACAKYAAFVGSCGTEFDGASDKVMLDDQDTPKCPEMAALYF